MHILRIFFPEVEQGHKRPHIDDNSSHIWTVSSGISIDACKVFGSTSRLTLGCFASSQINLKKIIKNQGSLPTSLSVVTAPQVYKVY